MMTKQTILFSKNPDQSDIDAFFRENIKHGNSFFPLAVYYTHHDKTRKNMIHNHWHQEMEILYIHENAMTVMIDNHQFIGKKGDIFIIPPNLLHEAKNHEEQSCAFFAIVFDPYFIGSHLNDQIQQSYINSILASPAQFIFHLTSDHPATTALREMLNTIIDDFALKSMAYELGIKGNLLLFFQSIFKLKNELPKQLISKQEIDVSNKCRQIINFIEENYQDPITLDDISEEIGFSRAYFCRFFKKNFHKTFLDFLTEFRIHNAEYLLSHSDLKITDLALETGFENASYFSSIFKEKTGQTPSAYRQSEKQMLTR